VIALIHRQTIPDLFLPIATIAIKLVIWHAIVRIVVVEKRVTFAENKVILAEIVLTINHCDYYFLCTNKFV